MTRRRTVPLFLFILLSIGAIASIVPADAPAICKIAGVPRIKQLTNYCGPATLAAVMQYYGIETSQEVVGKAVYNALSGATSGADMLYYARQQGMAAYSWNTNIDDLKLKLSAGMPVIALQQNSREDTSGHFRVITGYNDKLDKFYVMDPYYDNIKELTYKEADRLWRRMGFWALIVMPKDRDIFQKELNDKNPVVHMDLSYAMFQRKEYQEALKETRLALKLEPKNSYAQSMLYRIQSIIGTQSEQKTAITTSAKKANAEPDKKANTEADKKVSVNTSSNVSATAEKKVETQQDTNKPAEPEKSAEAKPIEKAVVESDSKKAVKSDDKTAVEPEKKVNVEPEEKAAVQSEKADEVKPEE